MPGRNAVTFSGKPSPVSARKRSTHSGFTSAMKPARAIESELHCNPAGEQEQVSDDDDLLSYDHRDRSELSNSCRQLDLHGILGARCLSPERFALIPACFGLVGAEAASREIECRRSLALVA